MMKIRLMENFRFSKTAAVVLTGVCVLASVFLLAIQTEAANNPGLPNFVITKSVDKTYAQPGEIITYTLRWENIGDAAGTHTEISDGLSQYLTFVDAQPMPDYGKDVWNLGRVAPGASGEIIIRARISTSMPPGTTEIKNTAYIGSDEVCHCTYSNTVSTFVTVSNPAPTCSISANPSSIQRGNSSTLNWSSQYATSCTASGAWSGSKSLSGAETVSPNSNSTYNLACSGLGGSVTCSASISVTEPGTPNLNITKSVNRYYADPGNEIVYTLNYTNTGTAIATNVVVRDPFINQNQSYLTFLYASPVPSSGTSTWKIGSLSAGGSGTITIRARITDSMPSGTTEIRNRGSISSSEITETYSNYVSTFVSYNYSVPSCYIYASPSSIQRGNSSTLNWSSQNATYCVAANAWSGTKSLSGTESVSPYYNSTFSLTCYNYSNVSGNCSTTISVNETSGNPNLSIEKLVNNITANSGYDDSVNAKPEEEVGFLIRVRSTGNTSAYSVRVKDDLPTGLTYISGSTTVDGSYASDGIIGGWIYIGSISSGNSKEIKFRVKVNPYVYGSSGISTVSASNQNIQISSSVSVNQMGRNITQNQNVWSYSFPAYYGDTIEFSAQLTNNSGSTLNNVTLKETLPSNLSFIANSIIVDGSSWNGDIATGINLGAMANGQIRTVKFRATFLGGSPNISDRLNNIAYASADNVSQVSDQATVIISSGSQGQVLGATVTTGANLISSLLIAMIVGLGTAFVIYCKTRENYILDYLNKKNSNKLLKSLIKLYFKARYIFKAAALRFKQIYF
jgi:uncharacterized repeat protein (TIGR01451 family)